VRKRRYEVPEMYALIDISNEMLEDSAFNMEGEIRGEAAEQFAVKEGAEIRGTVRAGQKSGRPRARARQAARAAQARTKAAKGRVGNYKTARGTSGQSWRVARLATIFPSFGNRA
jgi:HK97 family phage major capsid protein